MNNLLIWSFSQGDKLVFSSLKASLATITCCDSITVTFQANQSDYPLLTDLKGCALIAFKEVLVRVVSKVEIKADLLETVKIFRSSLGQILVEINDKEVVVGYFLVDFDTIHAWISQLNLLEIVMQENENEKKNKGKGCC